MNQNETQSQDQSTTAMIPLRDLLPRIAPSSKQQVSDDDARSIWTADELAAARQASIKRHLEDGWTLSPEGLLVKGEGRSKVEKRPTAVIASRSGEARFNPMADAFALRLKAAFVGPNRYRLGSLVLDANGACRDEEHECPECGSLHGEYRFMVRTANSDPSAQPWENEYTYCRRCVAPEELERARR